MLHVSFPLASLGFLTMAENLHNNVQATFAHIPLCWEWISALFTELAHLTYVNALSFRKLRESNDDSFRLHV